MFFYEVCFEGNHMINIERYLAFGSTLEEVPGINAGSLSQIPTYSIGKAVSAAPTWKVPIW
jgi:hypothetical protein